MHGLVTGQDPRQRSGDLEVKLENPLGFFESERLVDINEGLLQSLGCKWDRPPLLPVSWDQPPLLNSLHSQRTQLSSYALEDAWVDKDPRLCITYPAYLHILLRRIPLVVALREPLDVATSLHARNGFSLNHGLILWWIYNHHIASQLCPRDLLITYRTLLDFDNHRLQHLLGPFLENHNLRRPSDRHAGELISFLLKPQFNRAEDALNAESRTRIHPLLLDICQGAYISTAQSTDQLNCFKEQFNFLPRVVLDYSARDHLTPEADVGLLRQRLKQMEHEMQNACSSLEQRERDYSVLQAQLRDLTNSRSWKVSAPLRALGGFIKSVCKQ